MRILRGTDTRTSPDTGQKALHSKDAPLGPQEHRILSHEGPGLRLQHSRDRAPEPGFARHSESLETPFEKSLSRRGAPIARFRLPRPALYFDR